MPDKSAVIFGAGKIGRRFIAHSLTFSGFRIALVEGNPEVVSLLRRKAGYGVGMMGATRKDSSIGGFEPRIASGKCCGSWRPLREA